MVLGLSQPNLVLSVKNRVSGCAQGLWLYMLNTKNPGENVVSRRILSGRTLADCEWRAAASGSRSRFFVFTDYPRTLTSSVRLVFVACAT